MSATQSPLASPTTKASTFLFGFLVSVLSVFTVFMGFAIVWNRLVARRQVIDAMLQVDPTPLDSLRLLRPVIWDIWVMPDKHPFPWLDVKPVAARMCDRPTSSSQTCQAVRATSFWRRLLPYQLPPEVNYLFHRPIPPPPIAQSDTNISQVDLAHGSDIQVSLLIAMPRALQSTRHDHVMRHEMVLATTDVLYYDPAAGAVS